jgi:DNA-binding winged helix-turn-helix (wHTH) protein
VESALLEGSAVAAQLAAAEARQLSETIRTTNHALGKARKSLKYVEDHVASVDTVPGRNINLDNPSRWTIAKDDDNMAQFLSSNFGDDWTKSSATEEEGAESTVNEVKAAYSLKVLGTF